jgi:tRNA nucleotidyltransferase (CCA-adding enzyme)
LSQREPKPQRDLDLITTHLNADFDALASMLAVSKLYPDAMLVLPGAQERNLRNFFVETTCYLYNFVKLKNVPLERVKRLILVDTRQASRIGSLAELLDVPGMEVHAFDHHPDSEDDVKTSYEVVKPLGSTVTVLSRILRDRGITYSEDEATLLALGIYEDTGSFTFPSTTQEDFAAAAWLLGMGANLSLVSSLITRELTAEELGILNDMLRQAETFNINGIEVVVSDVSREAYVPELAVLVHRMMDIENLNALFVLARLEGRLYLVARSKLPEVDVGLILRDLGGGGHPTAASASLRDMTLVEAKNRLHGILLSHISQGRTAADLMTSPVISVPPRTSLIEAHDVLTRYSISVLPVVDQGNMVGLITSELVEKALFHGLRELPVSDYMERRFEALLPGASLSEVEMALVVDRRPMAPVIDQAGNLLGVITHTDLLQSLMDQPVVPESRRAGNMSSQGPRHKNLGGLMRERLSKEIVEILKAMGRVAHKMNYQAYLVGGSVRDLFLRSKNLDIDVVVEGDAELFAKEFAKGRHGLRVRTHRKFKTAKLLYDDGLVVDLVTARLEYYQAPAALPVVELSSLKMDLYRRDFTINTLAVSLKPGEFGLLIDFFDGLRDMKSKSIRVLHNLSFVEDPTRVLRAVRFEQRFGFRIGKFTEGLIKNAIKINVFRHLSGSRLFGEFRQLLNEERAGDCVRRVQELGLLNLIHQELRISEKEDRLLNEAESALAWYRLSFLDKPIRQWLVYMLALSDSLNEEQLEQMCVRLNIPNRLKVEILSQRGLARHAMNHLQRNRVTPSRIYGLLHPLRPAYQLYVMCKSTRVWAKRSVSLYLTKFCKVRPELSGHDLKQMGFEPGPLFKHILDRLLAARLDGEAVDREDEMEIVKSEFSRLMEKSA